MKIRQKPVVAHLIRDYLNPSENWIHSQITTQTRTIPIVLAKNTRNLDQFPASIHKYSLLSDYSFFIPIRKFLALIERLRNFGDAQELAFYIRVLRSTKASLIHAHYGTTGYLAIPLKLATKLPLVVSFYGSDINSLPYVQPLWRLRYKQLFQSADAIIVKGPAMKAKIVDLGCPAKKVHLIDAGIIVDQIAYKPRRPTKSPRLLIASRLVAFKGIAYAIQALKKVRQSYPQVTLAIIGTGPEAPSLKQLAKKLRLVRKITFVPFLPLTAMIHESYKYHLFLQPSVTTSKQEQEGIPTSLIQHMATGMPAVATNHSDIPEVVQNNHTGLLVPEKDPTALSQAIIQLIKQPKLWCLFSDNGRQLIKKKFNATIQTKKRELLYTKIINQHLSLRGRRPRQS